MMHENIKNYKESMDELHFSDIQKEKLIKRLSDANSEKNGGFMKAKLNIKKISAAVAACCILVGGTAFAAGHIATIVSHNRLFSDTTNFDDLTKLEQEANIDVVAVDSFSNGYLFNHMEIVDMETLDDSNNKMNDYSGIEIYYAKDNAPNIWLNMSPVMNEEHLDESSLDATRAQETRIIDGISLYYSKDEYLFLPATEDSQPTEEETKRMDSDDHFFISYGSDERETSFSSNVVFEIDGVIYDLSSFDNDMSAEEFLDMAEEIVRAK